PAPELQIQQDLGDMLAHFTGDTSVHPAERRQAVDMRHVAFGFRKHPSQGPISRWRTLVHSARPRGARRGLGFDMMVEVAGVLKDIRFVHGALSSERQTVWPCVPPRGGLRELTGAGAIRKNAGGFVLETRRWVNPRSTRLGQRDGAQIRR